MSPVQAADLACALVGVAGAQGNRGLAVTEGWLVDYLATAVLPACVGSPPALEPQVGGRTACQAALVGRVLGTGKRDGRGKGRDGRGRRGMGPGAQRGAHIHMCMDCVRGFPPSHARVPPSHAGRREPVAGAGHPGERGGPGAGGPGGCAAPAGLCPAGSAVRA